LEVCKDCIYKNLCEWIHKWYTELYWNSEFNPLIKTNKSVINYKDLIYTLNFIDNIIVDVSSVKNILELIKIIIIFAIKWYKTFFCHPYFLSDKHLLNLKKRYNVDYINLIKDIWIEKK
jgi:hypothetical protein